MIVYLPSFLVSKRSFDGRVAQFSASVLRIESCSPQVRSVYTDGELTLDVAVFESGLSKSCEISIRGSVCTLTDSRMAGAALGV